MAITINTALRNDIATDILARIDGGTGFAYIEIRTGAKPATPGDAATGTLLATFTLPDPAGSVTGAVVTLDCDPDIEVAAAAAGDPGWARVYDADDVAVVDGTSGTAGDFATNVASVALAQPVRLLTGTITAPL